MADVSMAARMLGLVLETMLVIPLQGGQKQITLTGRWPITGAQWEHLMAVLEAMKPGLVKD
jgi:hypothetical protein